MKINKITKYQSKLVKLKLIKTKIYKKNDYHFIKIEEIISRLKKALHIIYKYHINNKRILFVGTPIHIEEKLQNLIKNTRHTYIPESVWMNGILTNQQSCFKYLLKNQQSINRRISTILFKTKKKSDLIVVLDASANSNALNEGYLTRTPVISLNLHFDNADIKSSYKVPGNFKFTHKKVRSNFFYSILSATLRKAQKNYEPQKHKKKVIRKPFFKKLFKK
jgi:ribosomal protein S2